MKHQITDIGSQFGITPGILLVGLLSWLVFALGFVALLRARRHPDAFVAWSTSILLLTLGAVAALQPFKAWYINAAAAAAALAFTIRVLSTFPPVRGFKKTIRTIESR